MSHADFADVPHPVSDLFAQPSTPEEWQQYALSEDQVRHFETHGYVSGVRVLDEEQIDALLEALDRMRSPSHSRHSIFYEFHSNESEDPSTVLFHALGAWRVEEAFHDLLWAPAFRLAAYQLLGHSVRQFHDQLFCKPARDGGVVAWHQDYSYWTWTKPLRHSTCWIALDRSTQENGCLRYVPGSHRWGLLPVTGLAGDMDSVTEVLSPQQRTDFDRQVAIELPPGYASFHHPMLMHGSRENRSERQRRAAVLNVVGDGVRFDREAHPTGEFGKFPVADNGTPLGGEFYPLLLDAAAELGELATRLPRVTGLPSVRGLDDAE